MNNILSKIQFKRLSMSGFYEPGFECLYLKCVQEILVQKAGLLEELCFEGVPNLRTLPQFLSLDLRGQWLPNVRVLRFPPPLLYDLDLDINFIKELVEASPNLQELHGNINAECMEFIVPLKLAQAVKDFNFNLSFSSLRYCSAFSLESPKLNKFRFSTYVENDETMFDQWNASRRNHVAKIVEQILESSKASLKKIAFDHLDLLMMSTQWTIPVLKNVAHLSFGYDPKIDAFKRTSTLEKIDWGKYFPNLHQVSVTNEGSFGPENGVYLSEAFRQSNSRYVCESVRVFRSAGNIMGFRDGDHIQTLKHLFPNVKEFYLTECRNLMENLCELWTAWMDLESIYFTDEIGPSHVRTGGFRQSEDKLSYDSVFLGIDKIEANWLLENVQELESLEIVPTKPSIFSLRKLKKIEISLFHYDRYCGDNALILKESDFLSRLTGLCAFSRLPGLSVEIHRFACKAVDNCYMAFNNQKPFVKFVKCDALPSYQFELY